jgi:hypothetical protein
MVKNIIKAFSCIVALSTGAMAQADLEAMQAGATGGAAIQTVSAGDSLHINDLPEGVVPAKFLGLDEVPGVSEEISLQEEGKAGFIQSEKERLIAHLTGAAPDLDACALTCWTNEPVTWGEVLNLTMKELETLLKREWAHRQNPQESTEQATLQTSGGYSVSNTGSVRVWNTAASGTITAGIGTSTGAFPVYNTGAGAISGLVGGTTGIRLQDVAQSGLSYTLSNCGVVADAIPAPSIGAGMDFSSIVARNYPAGTFTMYGTSSVQNRSVRVNIWHNVTYDIGVAGIGSDVDIFLFPQAAIIQSLPGSFGGNLHCREGEADPEVWKLVAWDVLPENICVELHPGQYMIPPANIALEIRCGK